MWLRNIYVLLITVRGWVELFYLFLLSHSLFLSLSFSLKVCGLWLVFGGWMCFGELGGWQWSPSSSKCQFASCLIPSWQNVLFSRRCCWREGWGVKWASPVGELWLLSSLSNLASAVTLDLANTCLMHSSLSLRCVWECVCLGPCVYYSGMYSQRVPRDLLLWDDVCAIANGCGSSQRLVLRLLRRSTLPLWLVDVALDGKH